MTDPVSVKLKDAEDSLRRSALRGRKSEMKAVMVDVADRLRDLHGTLHPPIVTVQDHPKLHWQDAELLNHGTLHPEGQEPTKEDAN